MGQGLSDNQEVEHESGASRMCSAWCCAICGSPILMIIMIVLLGWNEKRAVCDMKAIAQGKTEAMEVTSCSTATEGDGELILISCDMSKTGLQPFTVGDFSQSLSGYLGTGLKIDSEMYQCEERVESKTEKDSVGGGKTTVKTYYYDKQWKSEPIDSNTFRKRDSRNFQNNCGRNNPSWPMSVPRSDTMLASLVHVGGFKIEKEHIQQIPLNTAVWINSSLPSGWIQVLTTDPYYYLRQPGGSLEQIGDMRIKFSGTNWASPTVTVLGKNEVGTVKAWVAADTWLCSGYTLSDLRPGKLSKDEVFEALESEASALTYILRIVGFVIGWVAFCLLAGPLEVAADCVPCIGPFLGDSLACVASCVACLPAFACTLGVIGIVWVVMRPMIGGILMGVFAAIFSCLICFKCYAKGSGMSGGEGPGATLFGAGSSE